MKKRILLVLMLSVLFALTGCTENLNFEVDNDNMESITRQYFMQYYNVSETEADYYVNDGTELEKTAVSGFAAAKNTDNVGEFVGFDDGENSVSFSNGANGKVVCTVVAKYENRNVDFSVSYTQNRGYNLHKEQIRQQLASEAMQNGMTADDYVAQGGYTSVDQFLDYYLANSGEYQYTADSAEVSAQYTKGELIAKGGQNTAIGMITVFAVLIFIAFIISLLKYVPLLFDKEAREKAKAEKEAKKAAEEAKAAETVSPVEEKESAPAPAAAPSKDEDLMNDEELVAVITAAIYAAEGSGVRGPAYTASNDKLVVRSIRRAR